MKNPRLEDDAIRMLLAGDDPVLIILREQLAVSSVQSREFTGVGFYVNFQIPDHVERLTGAVDFTIGDVYGSSPLLQHGFGFLLFIREGALSFLECFTYDEAWPDGMSDFRLSYHPSEDRDMKALRGEWSK